MNIREAINTIKTYLNMEVKLAEMKLVDGVTVLHANEFVAGQEVYIVSEEEKIPLPIGEYELEDGKILLVSEDGIIAEIKDAVEEEKEAVEPESEVPVEAAVETVEATPKKIIKSVSEEHHFAELAKLQSEIDALKLAAVEVIETVETVEEVELAKAIVYNPENRNEVNHVDLTPNAPKGMRDRILEEIYNNK
jgi:threonine synthase